MRYADFNTMDFVATKSDFGKGVHANGDFGNYGFSIADAIDNIFTSTAEKQSMALSAQEQEADIQRKKIITYALAGAILIGGFIVVKKYLK